MTFHPKYLPPINPELSKVLFEFPKAKASSTIYHKNHVGRLYPESPSMNRWKTIKTHGDNLNSQLVDFVINSFNSIEPSPRLTVDWGTVIGRCFLNTKTRPPSVPFLFRTSGKDSHSQAGSANKDNTWSIHIYFSMAAAASATSWSLHFTSVVRFPFFGNPTTFHTKRISYICSIFCHNYSASMSLQTKYFYKIDYSLQA